MEGSWTPVALAIPVFFLLIGVELLAALAMRRRVHRLGDALCDLGCGVLQQSVGVLVRTSLYSVVFTAVAVTEWSTSSAWTWVVAFLGVDCAYYWFHRTSHRVAFMWAAHVVHHQSEDYNLAVALRQGAVQPFYSWAFYLPLAVLGIPPLVFGACSAVNTLYQFWIHTRLVRRMGPLEWVLNTPSHHRVHHGRNDKYIDRNHAGTLIIWDRLFGTFQREEEEPTYGITHALHSFDPITAHVQPWQALMARSRQATGLDKLKVWFMPPGWSPAGVEWAPAKPLDGAAYDTSPDLATKLYAALQFTPLVPLTMGLKYYRNAPFEMKALVVLFMAWTLVCIAAFVEQRRSAIQLELPRLIALGAGAAALDAVGVGSGQLLAFAVIWAAPSVAWLVWHARRAAPRSEPTNVDCA